MKKSKLLLIEKVMMLKSLSIFSDTPETILAAIAPVVEEVELEGESVIFNEGEIGNCMYAIFRGSVRIHKGDQTLATLGEKDFFGELSLLDTETRSAGATTLGDCFLFRIDQEPFYDLMETRPEVVKGVIRILSKRLRDANRKLSAIGQPAS